MGKASIIGHTSTMASWEATIELNTISLKTHFILIRPAHKKRDPRIRLTLALLALSVSIGIHSESAVGKTIARHADDMVFCRRWRRPCMPLHWIAFYSGGGWMDEWVMVG
jgi:hypothetical protein